MCEFSRKRQMYPNIKIQFVTREKSPLSLAWIKEKHILYMNLRVRKSVILFYTMNWKIIYFQEHNIYLCIFHNIFMFSLAMFIVEVIIVDFCGCADRTLPFDKGSRSKGMDIRVHNGTRVFYTNMLTICFSKIKIYKNIRLRKVL